MLSKKVIAELRKELSRLTAARNQIEEQIGGIQALLGPNRTARRSGAKARFRENGDTFASQVRAALEEIGRRAKAKDVAAILRDQGISVSRACPLEVAVSAELGRMAKRRTQGVVKVGRGIYRIEQGGK